MNLVQYYRQQIEDGFGSYKRTPEAIAIVEKALIETTTAAIKQAASEATEL